MALNWNEIKTRAIEFSKEWENDFNEHAEAKSFMDAFFNVFWLTRRRVATFEQTVKKEDGRQGFIDLLWKGVILIEFKSRGKNLEKAHTQARDYFLGIKDGDLPKLRCGWLTTKWICKLATKLVNISSAYRYKNPLKLFTATLCRLIGKRLSPMMNFRSFWVIRRLLVQKWWRSNSVIRLSMNLRIFNEAAV